jgi:hypothetical protein
MRDNLKELSVQLNAKIKPQNHLNINFPERSFRRLRIKDYMQFDLTIDDHGFLYSIKVKVNAAHAFSINNPDFIFLFDKQITLPGITYTVYVSDVDKSPFKESGQERALYSIDTFLKRLQISKSESVFCYKNSIVFGLNRDRNLQVVVNDIIKLIRENSTFFSNTRQQKLISSNSIPNDLENLLPLCKKFAFSDDSERKELIEMMPKIQKKNLVDTVYPFINKINEYLSSFKDRPLSDEAIMLGNLAELVSELQFEHRS